MLNRRLVPASLLAPIACASAVLMLSCRGEEGYASAPSAQESAAQSAEHAIPDIRVGVAFPKLAFRRPVFIGHAGDGTDRLFVVEQPGRVRVFENRSDVESADMFLDIEDIVRSRGNEEGLLALAFHPDYRTNRHFFVYYTASDPRRGVLARFTTSADDPNKADPDSKKVILEVEQPYGNHNGASVLFGPDGFVYMSLGDGGYANDPHDNGQNLSTLLGTIIRIDVDKSSDGRAYAIPADNPFVGRENARAEIWAYGLRNVWRMSFDRETGDLWAADVGQNRLEEVDLITRGGNYGWRIREGTRSFMPAETEAELINPVVEYPRDKGISITGGFVYRGAKFPGLRGVYLYADYVSGRVWGLRYEGGALVAHREVLPVRKRPHVSSFGEDAAGEVYICGFEKVGGRRGKIYRIIAE